jgi:hypothetical protein
VRPSKRDAVRQCYEDRGRQRDDDAYAHETKRRCNACRRYFSRPISRK